MSEVGSERPIIVNCARQQMIGVVSGCSSTRDTGMVIVVGGPQYRVGSHRQFVHLSRQLAQGGFACLRFDVRGMGDSTGPVQSFEQLGEDIHAAIDALLRELPILQRVILWGLCDGASAALLYLHEYRDARVGGLVLANPWVRSQTSYAKTQLQHYYLRQMLSGAFWTRLLRGGIARDSIADALRAAWQALRGSAVPSGRGTSSSLNFQQRMAAAWRDAPCPILLLLSGSDYTAKEFLQVCSTDPAWAGALDRRGLQRHELPEADHTFSSEPYRTQMRALTLQWLDGLSPANGTAIEGASN